MIHIRFKIIIFVLLSLTTMPSAMADLKTVIKTAKMNLIFERKELLVDVTWPNPNFEVYYEFNGKYGRFSDLKKYENIHFFSGENTKGKFFSLVFSNSEKKCFAINIYENGESERSSSCEKKYEQSFHLNTMDINQWHFEFDNKKIKNGKCGNILISSDIIDKVNAFLEKRFNSILLGGTNFQGDNSIRLENRTGKRSCSYIRFKDALMKVSLSSMNVCHEQK